MTESDRRHIHGPLLPLETSLPAGPAHSSPAAQARLRIAIALACFWVVVMAILFLLFWS